MPPPIIYTIEQYNTLSAAIASGALEVTYGDKKVVYRSLDDMLRIQQAMFNQLFPNRNNNNGRTVVSYSKGARPGRYNNDGYCDRN